MFHIYALAFQLTAVCTYHFLPIHSLETLQTPSPEKSVLENMGFFKGSFIEWKVPNVTLVSYVPNVTLKRHVYVNLVNFGLTLLKRNLMLHRTRSFLWMYEFHILSRWNNPHSVHSFFTNLVRHLRVHMEIIPTFFWISLLYTLISRPIASIFLTEVLPFTTAILYYFHDCKLCGFWGTYSDARFLHSTGTNLHAVCLVWNTTPLT